MIIKNNITLYATLTIISKIDKCSFENIGKLIKKSGNTISRILRPGQESFDLAKKLHNKFLQKKKFLLLLLFFESQHTKLLQQSIRALTKLEK